MVVLETEPATSVFQVRKSSACPSMQFKLVGFYSHSSSKILDLPDLIYCIKWSRKINFPQMLRICLGRTLSAWWEAQLHKLREVIRIWDSLYRFSRSQKIAKTSTNLHKTPLQRNKKNLSTLISRFFFVLIYSQMIGTGYEDIHLLNPSRRNKKNHKIQNLLFGMFKYFHGIN